MVDSKWVEMKVTKSAMRGNIETHTQGKKWIHERKIQKEKETRKIEDYEICLKVIIEFKWKCWLKNERDEGNPQF